MSLQISQHINNKLLLVSIANYFKSPSKVYSHGTKYLQVTLSGTKLWDAVIFDHFSKYPLYGTKKLTLDKLFAIRELTLNKKHLMQVGKHREWIPDVKLRVINIWSSGVSNETEEDSKVYLSEMKRKAKWGEVKNKISSIFRRE